MSANHVLLQRIEVLDSTSTAIAFNNIPQTGYADLKLIISGRTVRTGTDRSNDFLIRLNGSSSGYSRRDMGDDAVRSTNGSSDTSFSRLQMPSDDATSNVFGNAEVYITNYTSSNIKTVTHHNASEDNYSYAPSWLFAGNWSGTESVKSITIIADQSGTITAGSSFSLYGIASINTMPDIAPKAIGGDIVKNDGEYWYHAFLNTGAFKPKTNLNCDILVVAGGGAGGASHAGGAGGGGAGGLLGFANQLLTTSSYTVTIGAGGASQSSVNGQYVRTGNNGSNSQFGSLTAAVGGGGGAVTMTDGANIQGNTGGSGGGTAFWNASTLVAGGLGTTGQGYPGGQVQGPGYTRGGSGGGGAGAAGGAIGSANGYVSTSGGIGATHNTSVGGTTGPYPFLHYMAIATSTGVLSSGNYYYAGGGGGANAGNAGSGGSGGGGAGYGTSSNGTATSGTANTGGGGGGASADASGILTFTSGAGGSGIVIVRYPMN